MRQLLALGLLAFAWAIPALAQAQTASVLSVGDGDTLRVREGSRTLNVRLACIDAPETRQAPHGASARSQLQAFAPVGSTVELRVKTTDRYGRAVAELSRGGRNLNQALVASGAAFVYWQYIARCDRQTYGRLETEARLKGLGVWGVSGGVMQPWEYRSRQRTSSSSSSAPSGRRYTCKQIGSYTQAQVLMRHGHTYLDGEPWVSHHAKSV
ncbi:MAG: thermonuclease family protein [Cyanobacteria bacterium M_surface_10_m1_298]|nr:thermonuclease family protein [Cyanobacteria bacterium M_surface_10_m1_298]